MKPGADVVTGFVRVHPCWCSSDCTFERPQATVCGGASVWGLSVLPCHMIFVVGVWALTHLTGCLLLLNLIVILENMCSVLTFYGERDLLPETHLFICSFIYFLLKS